MSIGKHLALTCQPLKDWRQAPRSTDRLSFLSIWLNAPRSEASPTDVQTRICCIHTSQGLLHQWQS